MVDCWCFTISVKLYGFILLTNMTDNMMKAQMKWWHKKENIKALVSINIPGGLLKTTKALCDYFVWLTKVDRL